MRALLLPPLHRLLLLSVASLLLLLPLSLPVVCQEVPFFTNVPTLTYQANVSTPSTFNSSNSTFLTQLPYSFPHLATSLLLYTNASTVTISVANSTTVTQLPPSASTLTSANLSYVPSILLLCLTADCPTSAATRACDSFLPSACQLTISLSCSLPSSSPSPIFSLSIYQLTSLPLTSGSTTSSLSPGGWHYYATYIRSSDLDVYFDLSMPLPSSPRVADVDFYLSTPTAPLYFIFPDLNDPNDVHQPGTEEGVLLYSEGGASDFDEGVYITGIYAPLTSAQSTTYQLTVAGGYDQAEGSFGLSLFAIVGALVILVLCLLAAVAVIARRRRYAIREFNETMQAATLAQDLDAVRRLQLMAAVRGLSAEGLLLLPQPHGVSEEEIRALPEYRFTRRAGESGDEEARCTICLDDYEEGASVLKKLGCGHEFHAACIGEWLKTARHPVCPLCLQNVRHAQDVAKKGTGESTAVAAAVEAPGVELQQVKPKVVVEDVPGGDDKVVNVLHIHEEERKEQ